MARDVQVDLIEHGSMNMWVPKVGDMIFKDGGLFRWCGVIDGIKDDNASVRKSGNPTLLLTGDYKAEIINVQKIKHARMGSYFVVSGGTYYV